MRNSWQIKIVGFSFLLFSGISLSEPLIVDQTTLSEDLPLGFAIPDDVHTVIVDRINQSRPDIEVSNLRRSPAKGLYKVDLNGQGAFVSEDGQFLIAGDMYKITNEGLVNLQEKERRERELAQRPRRSKLLSSIPKEDMVIYKPLNETKGYVYIFTDIDCGFCRKIHSQINDFLKKGIEVRYLAFPRAGIPSRSAQKLATVWCAKDMKTKKELMTEFKTGKSIPLDDCGKTPVRDHYMLGQDVGISATPAIILPDGELLVGARSPDMLAIEMGL